MTGEQLKPPFLSRPLQKSSTARQSLKHVTIVSLGVILWSILVGLAEAGIRYLVGSTDSHWLWELAVSSIEYGGTLTVVIFAGKCDQSIRSTWIDFGNGGIKGFVGLLVSLPLFFASNKVAEWSSGFLPSYPLVESVIADLMVLSTETEGLVTLLFTTCLVAPVVEEVFFRGFCYRVLRRDYSVTFSLLVSVSVFSIMHPVPAWVPHILLVNTVLCLSFELTGNLVQPIVIHSTLNGLAIGTELLR